MSPSIAVNQSINPNTKQTLNVAKESETHNGMWRQSWVFIIKQFSFYVRHQNASRVLAMAYVSVSPSHYAALSKWCKLRSWNLHCTLLLGSSFLWRNFEPPGERVFLEWKRERGVPAQKGGKRARRQIFQGERANQPGGETAKGWKSQTPCKL